MAVLPTHVRIATRESRLALAQAEMAAAALRAHHAGMTVELVGMSTKGDRVLDRPLAQVGGKGLFIKELEVALEDGRADVAVHSMKDVPMEIAAHFALMTFGEREVPLDAFVSVRYASLEELPPGAVLGTSSLRRECQLRHRFPRLVIQPLRGNVNTRLAKLDAGQYDAIILAAAGLRRLGLGDRIRATLPQALAIPAIAQGILGIESLRSRGDIAETFAALEVPATRIAALAERAVGRVVEGSCEVPVGAHARVVGAKVHIEGFIGRPDGTRLVRASMEGAADDAVKVGEALGAKLLAEGGRDILRELATPEA